MLVLSSDACFVFLKVGLVLLKLTFDQLDFHQTSCWGILLSSDVGVVIPGCPRVVRLFAGGFSCLLMIVLSSDACLVI